jgi:hypothetical protein
MSLQYNSPLELPAMTLTTTMTAAVNTSCEVFSLIFVNHSASVVNVTVQDGNGKLLLDQLPVQPSQTETMTNGLANLGFGVHGAYFAGGLYWQASANNAVDGWIVGS